MPANKLGTFKVETGKVYVSDPCYEKSQGKTTNRSLGIALPAVNGIWRSSATIHKTEGRVSVLTAKSQESRMGGVWTEVFEAGVDSGQMSIFDEKFYRVKSEGQGKLSPTWKYMATGKHENEKDGGGVFYGACCTLTCGEDNGATSQAGVLEHGAVSSTGWGDGSYPVFVKKNKAGKVVAVKVKFM